jgi:allantoate deiminase
MTLDTAGAARRLMERLDEFAGFTDEPGRITRLYLTPSYRVACQRYARWADRISTP